MQIWAYHYYHNNIVPSILLLFFHIDLYKNIKNCHRLNAQYALVAGRKGQGDLGFKRRSVQHWYNICHMMYTTAHLTMRSHNTTMMLFLITGCSDCSNSIAICTTDFSTSSKCCKHSLPKQYANIKNVQIQVHIYSSLDS